MSCVFGCDNRYVASSAVDTDFTSKLVHVIPPCADWPDGLSINIADSIQRCRYRDGYDAPSLLPPDMLSQGRHVLLEFEMYPTALQLGAGHQLRLDISSSSFPRFDVVSCSQPCTVDRVCCIDASILVTCIQHVVQTLTHCAHHRCVCWSSSCRTRTLEPLGEQQLWLGRESGTVWDGKVKLWCSSTDRRRQSLMPWELQWHPSCEGDKKLFFTSIVSFIQQCTLSANAVSFPAECYTS